MSSGEGGGSGRPLLPHHGAMVRDSALTDEVIAARGYWTATRAADLARLGFASAHRIPPSFVIPLYGLDGGVVNYQIRPGLPRIVDGKPVKYETPAGASVVLDVPPDARGDHEIRVLTGLRAPAVRASRLLAEAA
jgi:hypothetical protein